jgi:membrane-bound transcription factor site-1 protease
VFKKKSMSYNFNPANIKQIIMASSKRVSNANMYEQGNGKLNLVEAYRLMKIYTPQASLIPSYLDLTECPYFWPFCSQPLYFSGKF